MTSFSPATFLIVISCSVRKIHFTSKMKILYNLLTLLFQLVGHCALVVKERSCQDIGNKNRAKRKNDGSEKLDTRHNQRRKSSREDDGGNNNKERRYIIRCRMPAI